MSNSSGKQLSQLYKVSASILVAWTVVVACSFAWSTYIEQQQSRELATKEARSHFNKDKAFRFWGASHGGVYVPTNKRTPPNPRLSHIPERDVTTPSGKKLTLMNPAYMIRQMMNDYAKLYGVKGVITTFPDKLFNPNNAPDKWELAALKTFEQGEKEALEFTEIGGQPYLRLMRPLFIEETCLKCHAVQGYKVGDLRGGVGVSVPMAAYLFSDGKHVYIMSISHGVIWLLGLGSILTITSRSKARANERLLVQEVLLEAKLEAEAANRAKSEFLASMSHELRTPLNAVLGFAQMLEYDAKNPLSTVQKEHVDSILHGGNHLLELINEVLDLAKIEANQLSLFIEEVPANEVIAECVLMTSPLGEQRGITVTDHVSSGPPVLLRTDRMRVKQALINLISNAVKFNKDHGTVTIDGREMDDSFLRISVTDTGVGIAKEDYGSVFHMFHRLGADPMIAQEGTGIGLTVTKLLVERMAGRVGFESEVGIGSTFWLELPLASNEDVIIQADPQQSS